jgi:glycosyltransferase involved in cell wall biosynthesis
LNIAIDARELSGQPTGVGRYLSQLLNAWKELPAAAAHDFTLCAPDTGRASRGTAWEQFTLPRLVRDAGADVFFSPGYSGPLRCPVPMVVAIHDVSFAAHPEWFRWREGVRRRTLTRLSARKAGRVLTISEFSKREIVRHLGIDASKIEVTYLGVGLRTATDAARTFTGRGENGALVLCVGSLFTRRHIPELIQGFARLARRRADTWLEIVGDNRTTPHLDIERLAAAMELGDRVRIRSYVDDGTLASLYQRAGAFAFLSEYEGFGLTPLEALAAGVPIVVLDTPVAREIYGPAAVYVERPDPSLVEAALERVLFDTPERARILAAAQDVLARYSWRDCAERTLQVLLACGANPIGFAQGDPQRQ